MGMHAKVSSLMFVQGNFKKILEDNFLPASGAARILSFKEKVCSLPLPT